MDKPVKITDTTLRDAHQSLWATRMTVDEILEILPAIDKVGYHALEVWGGATFDASLRYLGEDPWIKLRRIKQTVKNTPLQMLLRGQNIVGYQNYPDDVVEAFIKKAVANGIDIIRIFDALNDIRNLEFATKVAKEEGAHVQGSVVYTVSPVHTNEQYLKTALNLVDMGVDSICIKDMAGLLTPYKTYDLIKLLKENISIPIEVHSHYVGGMAVASYMKAVEAGADIIDTASVPLAFGVSQPPVETLVRIFNGTPFDSGLNLTQLFEIADYFEELRKKRGFERGVTRLSDMQVFSHQVPGGMLTNLVSQLKQQKALDKIGQVLEEIPRVRQDLGFPPLVTPTSQIIGVQSVLNVLMGERYKVVPEEVKAYVRGYYGRPPAPIDEVIRRKIIGKEKPITCRPADLLSPRMEKIREELGNLAQKEEDYISYALFPQVTLKFLKGEVVPDLAGGLAVTQSTAVNLAKGEEEMNIKEIEQLINIVNNSEINELNIEKDGMKVNIKRGLTSNSNSSESKKTPAESKSKTVKEENVEVLDEDVVEIKASMVGTFYQAPAPDAPPYVKEGDNVKEGQVLCIIEAMKLMNEIQTEHTGKIIRILVQDGQPVEYGQPLFLLKKF